MIVSLRKKTLPQNRLSFIRDELVKSLRCRHSRAVYCPVVSYIGRTPAPLILLLGFFQHILYMPTLNFTTMTPLPVPFALAECKTFYIQVEPV